MPAQDRSQLPGSPAAVKVAGLGGEGVARSFVQALVRVRPALSSPVLGTPNLGAIWHTCLLARE
jgi:hypothetical protein